MNFKIQSMNKVATITSGIFLILGLLLMIWPEIFLKLFPIVIGGCLIIFGIYLLITNKILTRKLKGTILTVNPGISYLAIILGVIILCSTNLILLLFRNIIGIWLIIKGFVRLQTATMFRYTDKKFYISNLIMGTLMCFVGFYVLTTPNLIVKTIGTIVFIYSLCELISSLVIVKKVQFYESQDIPKNNVKEIEYTEINVEK